MKIYKDFLSMSKNKAIRGISLLIITVALIFTGCEDMLKEDNNQVVNPNGYKYNTADDNVYALSGILAQLQKLGERYVLLGELRGDLMDITSNANLAFQQIYNFNAGNDNPYNNIKDYYTVINNCNFAIENFDTTVFYEGEKILKRGYAAAKAIRAWTYMQIALNYGKAYWFEKPILNLNDALKQYPEVDIKELAVKLIPDLLPYTKVPTEYRISNYVNIPIRFILGELYLWNEQYMEAAEQYRDLAYDQSLITSDYIHWVVTNGAFTQSTTSSLLKYPLVSNITTTSEFNEGSHFKEYALPLTENGKYWIKPSTVAIKNWDSQMYYHNDNNSRIYGDLRGLVENYNSLGGNEFTNEGKSIDGFDNYIAKYSLTYKNQTISNIIYENITLATNAMIYLRYAEAVNRLGKPNLAFAVLKNGLNATSLLNTSIVPANEKSSPLPIYMDFTDPRFTNNIGVHAHGCGYPETAKEYVIPSLPTLADSVEYVENKIVDELALENAFDGNRFYDLMRVAMRRNNPAFLADKVSQKYTTDKETIRAKLMDINNWYLTK